MKTQHTPTPWIVSKRNAGAIPLHFQPPEVLGRNGDMCVATQLGNGKEAEANAEFIVRAVNSHDALVAALETLLQKCRVRNGQLELDQARAALALAKGEGK